MIGTGTITGKVGPGNQVTSLALTDVTSVVFDIVAKTVTYFYGESKSLVVDMTDLSGITSTVVENVSLDVTVTDA